MPVSRPTGPARATGDAHQARHRAAAESRSSRAPASRLTALATNRPPTGSLSQQTLEQAGACDAAADEDRHPGGIDAGENLRCGTLDDRQIAARRAPSALRAMVAQRPASALDRHGPGLAAPRSPRSRGTARSHSMAMEPEPAPTSHSTCARQRRQCGDGRGADLALGELAVVLESASGRPGTRGSSRAAAAGAAFDRQRVETRRSADDPKCSATPSSRRSSAPPRCSSTVMALGPKPRAISSAAARAGVSPSRLSTKQSGAGLDMQVQRSPAAGRAR